MAGYERRTGESAQAFAAARIYFELGEGRSLSAVAQKCNKSVSLLGRWSTAWDWVARARAWDKQIDAGRRKAALEQAEIEGREWARREADLRKRRYNLGIKLIEKAELMAAFPLQESTVKSTNATPDGKITTTLTLVKPAKWSFQTAGRLALIGEKVALAAIRNEGGDTEGDRREEEFVVRDWEPAEEK